MAILIHFLHLHPSLPVSKPTFDNTVQAIAQRRRLGLPAHQSRTVVGMSSATSETLSREKLEAEAADGPDICLYPTRPAQEYLRREIVEVCQTFSLVYWLRRCLEKVYQ